MKRGSGRIVLLAMLIGAGCSREDSFNSATGSLTLHFSHMVSDQQLSLNVPVSNPFGETVTYTHFAYYLSHFSLVTADNKIVAPEIQYFLIDEKNPGSKTLTLLVPEGSYSEIKMMVGVDSLRNVSGIQTGALDPANGMFWSWNTGYIFAKLEGTSPVSTAPLQNVTYHIGGFKTGENALQTISMVLPGIVTVKQTGHATANISANVDAWFNAVQPIHIATEPFCMSPGSLAQKIASNYAKMFRVVSISD